MMNQAEKIRLVVIDNDQGEIIVTLDGKELRGWSYSDDSERRAKMLAAREYVEGWHDGTNGRRNAAVPEPLRSIINSFSPGVKP